MIPTITWKKENRGKGEVEEEMKNVEELDENGKWAHTHIASKPFNLYDHPQVMCFMHHAIPTAHILREAV